MSVIIMAHVWKHSESKSGQLLVLLALADRANDDGVCWPGVNELARKSRLSPRQVERVLKELEERGELELPPGKVKKSNPYRIRQSVGSSPEGAQPDTGDGSAEGVQPDTGDEVSVTGDEANPSPVSVPYVEPSVVEPSVDPSIRAEKEIQEVWSAYLQATGKCTMKLDVKRRRHITNALKVAIGDTQAERFAKVKLAVIGLSLNPWNCGENPARKPFLDIRYALKGIKDESDDERIERMASFAADPRGVSSGGAQIDPVRVERRLEAIRANRSSGGSFEANRAVQARRELQGWGFRVIDLPAAPWARLEVEAVEGSQRDTGAPGGAGAA